jgi:choline dehydrogenase-like flavoprotein
MAILSRPLPGRSACLYDGWCDAGCPIGALANPLVTYLRWAVDAGAELRHRAMVTRIIHDASGRRVSAVQYHDTRGTAHRVRARSVVLAAFAVQNARLLLASASDRHPAGLGNARDQVGRYLMTHPATSVYGLFPSDTRPHQGPTGGQLICHDRYAERRRPDGGFGAYQWLIANAMKPNDLLGIANTRPDIYGPALEPFLRRAAMHFGTMVMVGEDLPLPDNRVLLQSARDRFGMPLARAIHSITPATDRMVGAAVQEGLEIFDAAGATERWHGPRFGMHILGGTVMGDDPGDSVADGWGRCHDLDNLYLAGTGLFPTSGAVNPTFTLHALALRTTEHLLAAL